ncbi:MAG: ATP-sensitive inward rectifier potassium channel 10 [Deltaproteobacteria bacterium]|nr:MAG: ATP-sensitive inward rectifier potassium channel 10 [Deltaproteobacteria bacterium]
MSTNDSPTIVNPPKRPPERELQNALSHVNRRRAYLTDLYASLLKMKWRYLLIIFATMYLLLNAAFATLFVSIGDCIHGAQPGSWVDAFFFSIQTLSTIGYGGMTPKGNLSNTLVAIESWLGILGVATFTGIIFTKFARPSARFLFSRRAVVHRRNGIPSLLFRVANERGNYVVEASMRATVLLDETTSEGDRMRKLHDIELVRTFSPIFILSWTAIHVIDETSPLYGLSPQEMIDRDCRMIISMSGIDGVFSQTIHAYHVYYPDELAWNARYVDVVQTTEPGKVILDYKDFHSYYELDETDPSFIHPDSLGPIAPPLA